MNENLNLVEILKDAPKGTKLWSPICGECILDKIDTTDTTANYAIHCLVVNDHSPVHFASDGKYTLCFDDGECVLFPSKVNRDWSTFKVPKKHKEFEPYQKVLVGLPFNYQYIWRRDIYLNYDEATKIHCTFYEKAVPDSLIIPYDKDKDGKQVPTKYYISSNLDANNLPKLQDD